ncbi:MAG: xanthine dehydrogenase family protein molybdopterin-binding subunit [bacterium]
MSTISRGVPRVDARAKTSGEARYLADEPIEDVLTAGLVLSEHAHARLVSVEPPPLPDGYVAVDHRDVPGRNAVSMINDGWPLFPESTVEYAGEPIALIAGPDPAVVRRLVDATSVVVDELPAVLGFDAAEAADTPAVFVEYALHGAPYGAAAGAAAPSLTETFETGAQEHVYLEPQAMAAWFEDGRITVRGSMQCPFYVRKALTTIFGWSEDRIRVVQTATGGAFGGKEEYPSVLAGYVALAAWKSGRPVRLILDRGEDIRITTKRHPSRTTFTSSVGDDGCLRSTSVDLRIDGGAYEGLSSTVLQRAMFSANGVYRVPRIDVRGRAYRTNAVPSGAFRGFGSPQAFFAVEMHMSHLARRLGEDPLAFKRRHLLRRGDRTITGGLLRDPVLMEEMIERAVEASEYARKRPEYESARAAASGSRGAGGRRDTTVRRGIGVSLFNHGCGFTGSGERDIIKARVRLRAAPGGEVEILCANVEMGQGALTTLRKIVAETLDIGLDRVVFENPDTDRVPDSGPTVASRTSMIVGGLLERAARKLIAHGWRDSTETMEVEVEYEQPEFIEWDQDRFAGDAYPAFSWGVNIVEIEVDTLTYEIRPISVWAVYDIGEAIDERVVAGQVHGGITQGLGYATCESLEMGPRGFAQASMTDYVIPGPLDVPQINVDLVSNPFAYGPYGAKGAGEIPFTGAAPALADAVECALGVTVSRIPMTPEYLEGVAE